MTDTLLAAFKRIQSMSDFQTSLAACCAVISYCGFYASKQDIPETVEP